MAYVLQAGAWPVYVWLAWRARRSGGRGALVLLWIGTSVVYGYVQYRLSCTVGDVDIAEIPQSFLSGDPSYCTHYLPVFAPVGLVAFGIASALVDRRWSGEASPRLSPRALVLMTLATMGAFVLASLAAEALSARLV